MRNRLAELAARIQNEEATVVVENDHYMEDFFQEVEEIQNYMTKIADVVEEVKKKHSIILSATHPKDTLKEELEELNKEIRKAANTIHAKLKAIEQSLTWDGNDNCSSADVRIRKSQHSVLTWKFVEIMTTYNKTQTVFRERTKDQIRRQLEISVKQECVGPCELEILSRFQAVLSNMAGKTTTDEELEDMLESGNLSVFTSDIILDSKIAREALDEIQSRHRDIIKLESSIQELHKMFVEVALVVEAQGEMMNSIEKSVRNAVEYIEHAKEETKKAVKYESKARRKKWIILIVVLVLFSVLALVIGLSFGIQ